jgi:ankyrin repeat protein
MGNVDSVKALIAAGADVNIADIQGETPLQMATFNAKADVVAILRAAGAKK